LQKGRITLLAGVFAAEIPNRRARVHAPRPDGGTPL
jgi:hypothetical protein